MPLLSSNEVTRRERRDMTTKTTARTCCRIMREEIERLPAIKALQLDPTESNLIIRYVDGGLSASEVDQLTARLRPALESNLTTCPVALGTASSDWCRSCAELADEDCTDFEARAGAAHGLISVAPSRDAAGADYHEEVEELHVPCPLRPRSVVLPPPCGRSSTTAGASSGSGPGRQFSQPPPSCSCSPPSARSALSGRQASRRCSTRLPT